MDEFLTEASAAARTAGRVLLEHFGHLDQSSISRKGPRDFVSVADHASEQVIISHLSARFPGHGFLAEESGGADANSEFQWIIDPLDGTSNFIHAFPMFTVSIALRHHDDFLVGLIYDPVRDEMFSAMKGGGATLNGRPVHVTSTASLHEALLSTGFPFRAREFLDPYLRVYRSLFLKAGIRRTGSAAMDLAYVAAGRFDGYWDLMLMPWDYAAGALIVREAGGAVSNFIGAPDLISGCIIACAPGIHAELLGIIRAEFEIPLREAATHARP
ncbi:MAG: inositol monophosphatase family protein [bacterium]